MNLYIIILFPGSMWVTLIFPFHSIPIIAATSNSIATATIDRAVLTERSVADRASAKSYTNAHIESHTSELHKSFEAWSFDVITVVIPLWEDCKLYTGCSNKGLLVV